MCAPQRRWIYKAEAFLGRASDLAAWKAQKFAQVITPDCGVLGMADKGMNDSDEHRLVTPYKVTQIRAAKRQASTQAEKDRIDRACTVLTCGSVVCGSRMRL